VPAGGAEIEGLLRIDEWHVQQWWTKEQPRTPMGRVQLSVLPASPLVLDDVVARVVVNSGGERYEVCCVPLGLRARGHEKPGYIWADFPEALFLRQFDIEVELIAYGATTPTATASDPTRTPTWTPTPPTPVPATPSHTPVPQATPSPLRPGATPVALRQLSGPVDLADGWRITYTELDQAEVRLALVAKPMRDTLTSISAGVAVHGPDGNAVERCCFQPADPRFPGVIALIAPMPAPGQLALDIQTYARFATPVRTHTPDHAPFPSPTLSATPPPQWHTYLPAAYKPSLRSGSEDRPGHKSP
jgi:hypothetical protein